MRSNYTKATLKTAVLAVNLLLLAVGVSVAQQQVNLTAGPAILGLPDGTVVPMWGYTCGAVVTGSTATCAKLNPAAPFWSPVVITVPTGQDLTINLKNGLQFNGNAIPTSMVIVGQLGGGLGASATSTPSPAHDAQQVTWQIANTGALNNPPPQGSRVQSFSTEVAAGATTALTWTAPKPGTYLIESGTHPSIQGPMGLYGILVVTSAPQGGTPGTAYPGVSYNAEIPLLFSEIDPAQNKAVDAAVNTVGFKESSVLGPFSARPITSVSLTNGGAGYTSAPTIAFAGGGGSGAHATAVVDLVNGSPTYGQVTAINLDNGGTGYTSAPSIIISGGGTPSTTAAAEAVQDRVTGTYCSGGAAACYPPVVNYTPLYYLINGAAFDKTNPGFSLFSAVPAAGVTGNVLVRMVNAGSRMHVPSIVGSTTGTAGGFALIAEDGNRLPGVTRVQSEVFMAAGKTYDVMVNAPTAGAPALPVFDRELSLSGNSTERDAGMVAYIGVNGGTLPVAAGSGVFAAAAARDDTYNSVFAGQTLTVSDPGKGVIANDTNVYGVKVATAPTKGTLTLNANGTFTYVASNTWSGSDSFTYCANGTTTICATVNLGASTVAGKGITCAPATFNANTAAYTAVKTPGVLAGCKDGANLALTATAFTAPSGLTVVGDANGGFTATASAPCNTPAGCSYTFTFQAQNSLKQLSAATNATVVFPARSGLTVTVLDGADHTTTISDYRWIIEEDRTFYVDPKCTTNPLPSGCPTIANVGGPVNFGTNFHTSYMPVVASGCTGTISCESGQTMQGTAVVCDVGNGVCRPGSQKTIVTPDQAHLDPTKRYYISVLPGDAAQPYIAGYAGAPDCSPAGKAAGSCGHGMGGAPIAAGQTSVTVLTQPSPYPTAKLTVFVFEDDFPLNGAHDGGGGVDVLSPQEPGLGGFQVTLFDDAGGTGDATGQPTYDMFNMPLTNSLAGTIDPSTGEDACPISPVVTANVKTGDGSQKGIVGMIVTCPKYESDGKTLSPMAGQVVVNNLYPGRYGVVAMPGADRFARGEEWLQTNTLDGQKAHDSFMRIGEPAYFQEFGPAGYHVTIGFANPKIINARKTDMCANTTCTNELKGHVTTARMSRPPDERVYGSGSRDSFAFTQCYASLGDPDGADFAFVKCDANGNFDFTGIPAGNFKLTIFDQWNDQIVDGISTPVGLAGQNGKVLDMGEVAAHQWQANIYTRTYLDKNGNGVPDRDSNGNDLEPGLPLVVTNNRFRDGSFSNFNSTDLNGYAGYNEVFPLFNWYVIETDNTRFKSTGTHVVYDAGGATDGTCTPPALCGSSKIGQNFANTYEANPLPGPLSVPGAVYCAEGADCSTSAASFALGTPVPSSTSNHSTGRIDPPNWFGSYGWQGFSGQNSFLEFGKKPFATGENGGIHGHVVYASTRPFDDPQLLLQLSWEPLVPHVRVNLYKEDFASDGVTPILTLVDHTETSSFDDWAQGFRSDGVPNMNCPGQSATDPFYFGLQNQPNYLDWYNSLHGGPAMTALPVSSQFKCYDGMHNWNQLQPAPYDGMYSFPSVTSINPTTGKPAGTNCIGCTTNPDSSDPYRFGTPMLPAGKYVVEVVVPPGYELVKEEDKNILIGDNYIAPVTQQFAGLGNVFILPDQAEITNASNPQNQTGNLGRAPNLPSHEGDTGSDESFWPCVGEARVVPDFISLFPGSQEVAPFAGATRNLCDRKEVALTDQTSVLTKFYIFTPTHVASHYTGVITDDFTAEFDPFSPQFGEKFAPAFLPVSLKDWAGNEISRTYADEWGAYNGLSYSTWEVNPPNPTGYGPTMMVTCMNDAGTGPTPDPLFQPGYSQFCYELPFMPGQTGYFDTPVVPTSAFSEGYNHPECAYPDATPAISEVDGDGVGPWVSAAGHTLTITSLGDVPVDTYAYSGPAVSTAPFNQQKVTRHYGFGTQCTSPTAGSPTCNTLSKVTIGGDTMSAIITSWSDTSITVQVPTAVGPCAVQQQAQYGGSPAQCGQLVITAGNGKKSIDAVTVTIGGKPPTRLTAGAKIQPAIDTAKPGDMIIVPKGVYNELLLMWKPIRLQGVGAASSIINANTHPAGQAKMDPWRRQVVCLFGLAPDGTASGYDPSCGAGWTEFHPASDNPQVDRLPLEATVGWTAVLNGNLAEQLIEPTLMGAYEGAGITVLSKGVRFPAGSTPFGSDIFPTGTQLLNNTTNSTTGCGPNTPTAHNPFPSNFWCNPSSIDGLSVTNSSQGGGGIQVHGWGHNIQIANNRIHNNQGTLSGGITVGQGEHPDVFLQGGASNTPPGSCESALIPNRSLPFCFDMNVNIHNNAVTVNSSLGDELFSSTPAGAGGVTVCNGSDYYNFNYNWVCGNMSTGDGGGFAHIGFTKNGSIEHNSILFNQSTNPTITTNGGGLLVMGAPDIDPTCGGSTDQDCLPAPGSVAPSDGSGPGLVINANLITGNAADSGSGGGLRLQHINGSDVINFPNGLVACLTKATCLWNTVTVTNNIITNNVAGWDGAGVSLQDALAVDIVNNTIASNDSTASAGPLFGSLFAPLASTPGTNCTTNNGAQSCPQVAGLVSVTNGPVLQANLPTSGFSCPPDHGSNGSCRYYSVPRLYNNVIWQNRSFFIGVGGFGSGQQNQQKVVTLFNSFTTNPAPSQPTAEATTPNGNGLIVTGGMGACTAASYWDVGVRGDTGPSNHVVVNGVTLRLAPAYSVISDVADYPGANNTGSNPTVLSQYCNGSRVPPELGNMGYTVNPGTNETNGLPTPVFSLTPSATVDEGNNWINLRWGPLALANPLNGSVLGNYGPASASPVINYIPSSALVAYTLAPSTDFWNNPRKTNSAVDAGAVEFLTPNLAIASVTGGPLTFTNVVVGTTSTAQTLTLRNTGGATLTGITVAVTAPFNRAAGGCGTTLAAGATCAINVTFSPANTTPATGTVTITGSVAVAGSPVALSGTGVNPVVSATLTPTNWAPSQTRNCPTPALACALDPIQTFTLTNTGNVPLTGVGAGVLGGTAANRANYALRPLLSTCGNATHTTLAPGATCVVTVQFQPQTSQAAGVKPATVSVTDAAGTQTSTLNGTAN